MNFLAFNDSMAGGFDAEFTDSPSMKGLWWLETDNTETPQIPPIKDGSYVKAYIITTHLLEVINTRLQAEALSKDTEVQIKKNNPEANLANSMSMLNENTTDNGQQQTSGVGDQRHGC